LPSSPLGLARGAEGGGWLEGQGNGLDGNLTFLGRLLRGVLERLGVWLRGGRGVGAELVLEQALEGLAGFVLLEEGGGEVRVNQYCLGLAGLLGRRGFPPEGALKQSGCSRLS
jgi:hypothetical protein